MPVITSSGIICTVATISYMLKKKPSFLIMHKILAGQIGAAIGDVVDSATAVCGLNTDATTPATTLGKGVGSLLELNIVGAISQIGNGIVGIVNFGIDAISQIKAKQTTA